jgi:hypothetical protein
MLYGLQVRLMCHLLCVTRIHVKHAWIVLVCLDLYVCLS